MLFDLRHQFATTGTARDEVYVPQQLWASEHASKEVLTFLPQSPTVTALQWFEKNKPEKVLQYLLEVEAKRLPLDKFLPVEDEDLKDLHVECLPYPVPPLRDEFAKFPGTYQDPFGADLKERNKARY